MPCCCATDLKAAYVLGIVLAGVSLVPALTLYPPFIAVGIVGALIHGVLVFGAYKSHSTAILTWMGLACLSCLGIAIVLVYVIVDNEMFRHGYDGFRMAGFGIALAMAWILVQVWTIKVAYDARKAIEEAGK